MDESNPSNQNQTSDTNNESDNRLAQYMLINKELSKSIVVLKAENARLRNHNKDLNLENLSYRNELTGNRTEIMKWKRKFAKLQTMHIQHVELLTGELQSYADKLGSVFGNDDVDENDQTKITSRVVDRSTSLTPASTSTDASRRVSRSFELPKPDTKIPDRSQEKPSDLNTINEESEEENENTSMEQISLVTSTYESTITNVDSNKENERPSTFLSSSSTLEENPSTIRANKTPLLSLDKSPAKTPLKEKFVTKRRVSRRHREAVESNPFESAKTSELVSSTPYRRKTAITNSVMDMDTENTTPRSNTTRSSVSSVVTSRATMSISSSGRPKRKVSPVDFTEPKLNTKLRRPRS